MVFKFIFYVIVTYRWRYRFRRIKRWQQCRIQNDWFSYTLFKEKQWMETWNIIWANCFGFSVAMGDSRGEAGSSTLLPLEFENDDAICCFSVKQPRFYCSRNGRSQILLNLVEVTQNFSWSNKRTWVWSIHTSSFSTIGYSRDWRVSCLPHGYPPPQWRI